MGRSENFCPVLLGDGLFCIICTRDNIDIRVDNL